MEEISSPQLNESYGQQFSINLSAEDMKSLAGWTTFKAIIDIIAGAIACLGIITAAYGIPQIIAGIRLLEASGELKRYISENNSQGISALFLSLQKHFKLYGISIIIKLSFVILSIILFILLIGVIAAYMPDILNDMKDFNYIY